MAKFLDEVLMLHWTYIAIAGFLFVLVLRELFAEQNWRNQIALALVLIPLALRILHIK
ncbi:MAG: hypothetical protein Q8P51_00160 [Ignavibacteria bacterium]|nr:hypothetical protein [Ignavibacteria bacterium]